VAGLGSPPAVVANVRRRRDAAQDEGTVEPPSRSELPLNVPERGAAVVLIGEPNGP
jgi:hypothetical protein